MLLSRDHLVGVVPILPAAEPMRLQMITGVLRRYAPSNRTLGHTFTARGVGEVVGFYAEHTTDSLPRTSLGERSELAIEAKLQFLSQRNRE